MTMLDRLTEAAYGAMADDWDRDTLRAVIRAVLAELREPSEALCNRGVASGMYNRDYESPADAVERQFTAMIDAILNEDDRRPPPSEPQPIIPMGGYGVSAPITAADAEWAGKEEL